MKQTNVRHWDTLIQTQTAFHLTFSKTNARAETITKPATVPDLRPVPALPPLLTLIRLQQALLPQTAPIVRVINSIPGLVLPRHVPLIRFLLVRLTETVLYAATANTSLRAAMTATMYRATHAKKTVFRQVMKQVVLMERMTARTVAAAPENVVPVVP